MCVLLQTFRLWAIGWKNITENSKITHRIRRSFPSLQLCSLVCFYHSHIYFARCPRSSQSNSRKQAKNDGVIGEVIRLCMCHVDDQLSCFRSTSPQAPRSPKAGERHTNLSKSVDRYVEYRWVESEPISATTNIWTNQSEVGETALQALFRFQQEKAGKVARVLHNVSFAVIGGTKCMSFVNQSRSLLQTPFFAA